MRLSYGCGENNMPFPQSPHIVVPWYNIPPPTLIDLIERGFLWITRPFLPRSLYATINGVSRATLEDVVCI